MHQVPCMYNMSIIRLSIIVDVVCYAGGLSGRGRTMERQRGRPDVNTAELLPDSILRAQHEMQYR